MIGIVVKEHLGYLGVSIGRFDWPSCGVCVCVCVRTCVRMHFCLYIIICVYENNPGSTITTRNLLLLFCFGWGCGALFKIASQVTAEF